MKRFYDVAVVGGGAAGIAAALAAAECGRSVVLIEDYGFFGGTATISGVQSYCGFLTSGPHPERVVAGMGLRVLEALQAFGHPVEPVLQSSGNWIILLDPERLKVVLDRLVLNAGITPLLHCRVIATEGQNGHIDALLCSHPEGHLRLEVGSVVDATGNANVAAMIAPHSIRPRLQAATLTVRIGNVAPGHAPDREALHAAVIDYQRRTQRHLARSNGGYFVPLPWSGSYWAMMIDVDLVNTDAHYLTRAEIEARSIAHDYLESLRRTVPGFEQAILETSGPQLGIRSTRCVTSQQDVLADDALSARQRANGIARSGWPCELHPGCGVTEYRAIPHHGWFHVPFGALIPEGSDNLWLAGSSIGADDIAFGSVRVMGTSFATGHAAGVSAALSSRLSQRTGFDAVKRVLLEQGALL
ncbi:MAG: FAD-dependent oxidoreductase [Pseudomonas sp. PGPPP1]|jgi:hypothetical protein|uniref:FAD-dependent oxidoreductase n=1 Tax=Pseudomonas cremoris TaxID=2724178 RepID=A0A7X1ALU2_9PSED|nr:MULTISPECIES: FAD-dependent oxidoreductase [Pseudomonas]MBC2406969.1 FAD-dependent oxidoreductase [Pseudomonas cremoris]OYU04677.1 MAG: FAD-dependent oxidoreductase [Pseudomonas sp. PGPPP1]